MSELPESVSNALFNFMLWCQRADLVTEVRAAGIRTIDFDTDRVATIVPMWNNFSAVIEEQTEDFHYLKVWVPVWGLTESTQNSELLTNLPFSIGQYPAADGQLPGARWPRMGELGLVYTQPLNLVSENAGIDFLTFAVTCRNLVLCAQVLEGSLEQ